MKEQAAQPVATKLKKLVLLARDLRAGENFQITRLTVLKSWCEDPLVAGRFALHLAERSKGRVAKRYKQLIASALRQLKRHLTNRKRQADELLWQALTGVGGLAKRIPGYALGTRADHPLPGSPPGGACSPLRGETARIGTLGLSGSATVRRAVQPALRNGPHPRIRLRGRRHRYLLGSRAPRQRRLADTRRVWAGWLTTGLRCRCRPATPPVSWLCRPFLGLIGAALRATRLATNLLLKSRSTCSACTTCRRVPVSLSSWVFRNLWVWKDFGEVGRIGS